MEQPLQIDNRIEIWRVVDGYQNYAVSNLGRVINIITGKILKNVKNTKGYFKVILQNKNNRMTVMVHRLVYLTFNKKIGGDECVHHINGDKHDNNINNLISIKKGRHTVMHIKGKKIPKLFPEEFKRKQRLAHLGKRHTDEAKKKVSESLLKYYQTKKS